MQLKQPIQGTQRQTNNIGFLSGFASSGMRSSPGTEVKAIIPACGIQTMTLYLEFLEPKSEGRKRAALMDGLL